MTGALLFWGWESGLLLWGVLLAAALEGSRLVRTRWELSNTDLNRISDLCWALVVGTALLLYSTGDRLLFVFRLVQWLPVCFCPLMLAQAYGNRAAMPLSVFWWLLRRSPASQTAGKSYNISYCYFAFCLLASSASKQPNGFFYPGITLLVALALTSVRPRRVSLAAWVVLLALAASAGEFSQKELHQMQDSVERVLAGWLSDFFRPPTEARDRECPTTIGSSRPMEQSGQIVLRVRPEPGGFAPALLREATWDVYNNTTWLASTNDVGLARSGNNDTIKLLPDANTPSCEVEIASYYENGSATLVLPHGTFEIDDVPVNVKTNSLGMAMVEDAGFLDMRASFGPGRTIDSPPTAQDTVVEKSEVPVLAAKVNELKLAGMSDQQKIRAIERFFADPANHFTYSLNPRRLPYRLNQPTALGFFLKTSRVGHCQYFATATVLLLRQAGLPARYATGYAVQESERHGDTYLVRARDAHAWALVYTTNTGTGMGIWEQIDTTPGDRDKAEAVRPPWWEPASDAVSNLYFQFSKWRWSKTSYARFSSWLLVPMILYLTGRIVLSQRRKRGTSGADDTPHPPPWPGLDSELYLIDRQLASAQLSRLPNEPLLSWQQRLERAFPDSERLRRIFLLHRSLRFDPRGLEKDDRDMLRNEARRWQADFSARMAAEKTATASRV
jgi:hypothetical protein